MKRYLIFRVVARWWPPALILAFAVAAPLVFGLKTGMGPLYVAGQTAAFAFALLGAWKRPGTPSS